MSYSINQIKVFAYNRDFKDDFTVSERDLYCGLAYCYDWFRLHPDDKENCEALMGEYIYNYLYLKDLEERKEVKRSSGAVHS